MRELKAEKLIRQINELYDELHKHQNRCKHPKATKTPVANTGNWDPNDDSYWNDCVCPTCQKRWTEDQ